MLPVLGPIRERRQQFAEKPDAIVDLLKEGSARARRVAQQTMEEVRQVVTLTP
jgi:tryptophanyl-tRNA synthetase